jgi:hypothetical protein
VWNKEIMYVCTVKRLCGLVVRVRFPALPDFFFEVVVLERDPLSLVSTTEELLERKSSGFGLETEITVVEIHRADHATLSIRKNRH